jgi:hypothetical protein
VSAAETIEAVRALGIIISECNGRLWVKPASKLPPALKTLVVERREELMAYLVAFRNAERTRLFGPTVILTAELLEPRACSTCRSTKWWRHQAGTQRICGVCRPPRARAADVVWLDGKGGRDAS